MLLQQSSLDVLRAENERNELRHVFQVENAVLVMRFMWCSNLRLKVRLKITPRLQMCDKGDGSGAVNGDASCVCVVLGRDSATVIILSDLSQFCLRKLICSTILFRGVSFSDEGLELDGVCVSSRSRHQCIMLRRGSMQRMNGGPSTEPWRGTRD